MRLRNNNLKQSLPDSPDIWLNKLSHHYVAPHTGFHYAIPDPSSVPSIAASALEYDDEQSDELNYFAGIDPRFMPRLEEDSEMDFADTDLDPLEHAEVFTTEEAAKIYLEKLKHLKSLYVGEFKRLNHILRENRRDYLHALKLEKDSMMSIHAQPKESHADGLDYKELKCLSRYHKHRGQEALLYKQNVDKKMMYADGMNHKPINFVKCIYSEGSWRCGERCVPMAKHCFKHILQDSSQVLFQVCGSVQGEEEECLTPVIPLPHTPTCIYHTPPPSLLPITKSTASTAPSRLQPEVVNLSDSSVLIVSEMPPDDVMEGDSGANTILNTKNYNAVVSRVSTRSTSKKK